MGYKSNCQILITSLTYCAPYHTFMVSKHAVVVAQGMQLGHFWLYHVQYCAQGIHYFASIGYKVIFDILGRAALPYVYIYIDIFA